MATLYCYKFNNYYNRRLKIFNTLQEYGDYNYIESDSNLNFNPGDGVNAKQILGRPLNPYFGNCDYVIYSSDNISITSRWFVISQTRKLGTQYQLELKRDVLADSYYDLINADAFIEKAILPFWSPLIYNLEDFSVNQIKQSETLLKDSTNSAWIVGYVASNTPEITATINAETTPDIRIAGITNWQYYVFTNKKMCSEKTNSELTVFIECSSSAYGIEFFAISYNTNTGKWRYVLKDTARQLLNPNEPINWNNATNSALLNQYINDEDTADYLDNFTYNNFQNTLNKVILDTSTAEFYKPTAVQTWANNVDTYSIPTTSPLYQYIQQIASMPIETAPSRLQSISPVSAYTDNAIKILLNTVPGKSYLTNFPSSEDRQHLKDAPYDMFCIPYNDNLVIKNISANTDLNFECVPGKALSMTIAQGLAKALGSNLYDLQLLPYCPMSGFNITTSGEQTTININTDSPDRFSKVITDGQVQLVYLWSTASSGSFNINHNIPVENKKVSNQCDMYRLVSPNYSGQFEFNVAKNNGVTTFNVDYTYKPYQPYIHINPVFSGIYGQDFNDARGLICGGDFSLSYLSDAWIQYTINNKNYANIFDREIQNMEFNNKFDMLNTGLNALTGAGAIATMIPILGKGLGIVGAGASVAGGIADIGIKAAQQHEALDYKKDMFGMQLENVKALPNSISKMTAFNENNKIFPTLEFYSCTQEEKTAFANKIAWNSMKVGVIGKISTYISNSWSYLGISDKGYIKAELIRMNSEKEEYNDFHFLNAIAEELFKGVYTK